MRHPRATTGSGSGLRRLLDLRTAAGQVFVLQVVIVVLLVAAAVTAQVVQASRDATREARHQSVSVAETFANAPGTAAALKSRNPTAILQPRAEAARKKAGVDFIVVLNTKGIRYTHPDPGRIGKKFIGTIGPSLDGRTTVEKVSGNLQPGKRVTVVQAVVPVIGADGSVVGAVSVGLTVMNVTGVSDQQLPIIFGTGAAALVLSTAGRHWCRGGCAGRRTGWARPR